MELVIRSGGVDRRVRVGKREGRYEIEIAGGERFEIDVFNLNGAVRSLVIDGAQHDVAVRAGRDGRVFVTWQGRTEPLDVVDPLTHLARESRKGAGAQAKQHITAYMPGRVVALRVAEGEAVEAGQPLLVLEAMKMQNEIQAEAGGVVRRILVAAGQAVEGGDPLLEIE